MPSLNEARLRYAAHYFLELDAVNDLYIEGGDGQIQALEHFDRDSQNIRNAQRWLADFRHQS